MGATVVLLTSGTLWTVPTNCVVGTALTVECWGGGSGGSGGNSFSAGGGASAYASSTYIVTPNDISNGISFAIGSGSAGTTSSDPSAAGSTSWSINKNLVPNSIMAGAAIGGALPTGWLAELSSGLSVAVANLGIDAATGLTFIDLHFTGTASGADVPWVIYYPPGSSYLSGTIISVSPSTTYVQSGYFAIVAGSTSNLNGGDIGEIQFDTFDNNGNYVGGSYDGGAISLTSTLTQFSNSYEIPSSGVSYVDQYFQFNTAGAGAIDITIRIAGLQFEASSTPTYWQSTPGYTFAQGGGAPVGNSGGAGGSATSSVGSISTFSGGSGANTSGGGAGGGGSGGKLGAGSNGGSGSGGASDNGSGGAGGNFSSVSPGSPGGSNVEGGGGGGAIIISGTGGAAGAPGGGGGSGGTTGGAGAIGQIRISYIAQPYAIINVLSISVTASLQQVVNASSTTSIEPINAVAGAVQTNQTSSTNKILSLNLSSSITQFNLVTQTNQFFLLNAIGNISNPCNARPFFNLVSTVASGQIPRGAACTISFNLTISASLSLGQPAYPATATLNFLGLSSLVSVTFVRYLTAQVPVLPLQSMSLAFSQGGNVLSTNGPTLLALNIAAGFYNPGTLYSYTVSWSLSPTGPWTNFGGQTTDLSEIVNGLSPNTPYWFEVISINNNTQLQGAPQIIGPISTT